MSKLKFNAETPLYTSDAKAWRIEQLSEVLINLQGSGKPIVFFVHGRGKEPGKSLRGATFTQGMAVHKIERGYDVRVLMLNWDSAFNGFNFLDREVPLSHTKAGGEMVGKVLSELKKFYSTNGGVTRPALLVHSMGSIVIQHVLKDKRWPEDGSKLFSSVLFSQPDADDVDHESWLEMLSETEKVFVTLNKDDHVLRRSDDARPVGTHALGLGTTQPLARHAIYVDLSNMGSLGKKDEDHEVFGKGAMNGQVHVCKFFTELLTGQDVVLDREINVESIEREVVYKLRSFNDPEAPCLKIPELPAA